MDELLINAGLTEAQASAYLYLLDHGTSAPPAVATALSLTRSNAYKVMDSLQDLGLVSRKEEKKKIMYVAADPSALATLVAEQRNKVIALEHNVKDAMGQLRAKYRKSTAAGNIDTAKGAEAIQNAYIEQAGKHQDIYFLKSRADIPFMGFETMNQIRHLTDHSGVTRFGITPQAPELSSKEDDRVTNLERTLIPPEAYTAAVEWSVSGDELIIIKFDGDGELIRINDAEIADSFRQLWKIAAKA